MIKHAHLLILYMLFLGTSGISLAQIKGIVVSDKGAPLEYASIAVYNQNDSTLYTGVLSELNGQFTIADVKTGSYYFVFSFIGYNTKVISNIKVNTVSRPIEMGLVKLTLGSLLDEIVIQAERESVINKIDRQIYNANKFKNALGGTAIDVLSNLPSVSIDGLGEISVRGSTGFMLLLNGKPIQGSPSTIIGQIPANDIERVELITAPSAKYDPDGTAGIINIITKKGATNGAYGQVNVKMGLPSIESYGNDKAHKRYGIDGTYNIRNDKWNLSISGSYQRNDLGGRREGDVYTIIRDTMTRFPSTGERSFDEINYSARLTLDYNPDTINSFSMGFFAGKRSKARLADIVYFDDNATTPPFSNNRLYTFQYFNHNLRERKSDFALGSIDYNHIFKNQTSLSASVLYEYSLLGGPTENQNLGFPNESILYQDEYNTNDNPLNGVRLQVDYSLKPMKIGEIEMGYQYRDLDHTGDFIYQRRTDFDDAFELVPEFSSAVDLKRRIHAGYIQLTGQSNRWEYAGGIRVEAMNRSLSLKDATNTLDVVYDYDFAQFFPSAALQYQFNKKTAVKAAYSRRVERTTTFKMNPFPEREHSETLEQGDPELLPEFIDLVELGLTQRIDDNNSLFATAYYREIQNVVNRVNTIYNETILNRIYSNVGVAKAIGLEMGAQLKPTSNWSNFIGATIYSYSIDGQFDNKPIESIATTYSVNLNSAYRFGDAASIQFTFNYLSDRVTAQGEDSRYYSPNLSFQKTFFDNRLTATLQWQNIDMGLMNTNEQRITTFKTNEFYTTTNYIYEVDIVSLNLSYTFKNGKNKSKFIKSEFGKREF